jgi:RNA polymerase sigma-70 factor (ECF subfamily)
MSESSAPPPRLRPSIAPTDEELLLRYRATGDAEAFESLVRRYEKPLFSYLLRYLHSPTLVEDVVQTTFLHVHQKRHLFATGRRVRPWLFGIATHLAVDELRRQRRRRAISLDAELADDNITGKSPVTLIPSRSSLPLERLETEEQLNWARRAIDLLPEPLHSTALLAYHRGMTLQEIAEALHVPLGTVKSRLSRALAALGTAIHSKHAAARYLRKQHSHPPLGASTT